MHPVITSDIVIVGAGVVGTSIAYSLIPYDVRVLLLDKNNDVAMGATRANSAIIHAGYDPKPGTLMAKLNVEGNSLYEKLCHDLSVPFRRCGSLVLAFSDTEKTARKTAPSSYSIYTLSQTALMESGMSASSAEISRTILVEVVSESACSFLVKDSRPAIASGAILKVESTRMSVTS